jgi:hypothetical protein
LLATKKIYRDVYQVARPFELTSPTSDCFMDLYRNHFVPTRYWNSFWTNHCGASQKSTNLPRRQLQPFKLAWNTEACGQFAFQKCNVEPLQIAFTRHRSLSQDLFWNCLAYSALPPCM